MRAGVLAIAMLAAAGCRSGASASPAQAADARCENAEVPIAPVILVVVAHPDDDVTAFAGILHDAVRRDSRVRVAFATDGQASCSACAHLTEHTGSDGCTRAELDELGRTRRREAIEGLAVLGVRDIVFLGFDDGTLDDAWTKPDTPPASPLCTSIETDSPRTAKTGSALHAELRALVTAEPWAAVFTTHPLDGHPDHAAVARFVATALADLHHPPPHFAAVLHTRGQHDCKWPAPAHPDPHCPSAEAPAQPTTLRYRPHDWLEPPTDATYGEPILYCLADAMLQGERPLKRRAIEAHRSQMGPVDVAAAMLAFVRKNEIVYRIGHRRSRGWPGARADVNPR
jgi:LmbE family N-acetylglucosaminyl deacetylase